MNHRKCTANPSPPKMARISSSASKATIWASFPKLTPPLAWSYPKAVANTLTWPRVRLEDTSLWGVLGPLARALDIRVATFRGASIVGGVRRILDRVPRGMLISVAGVLLELEL